MAHCGHTSNSSVKTGDLERMSFFFWGTVDVIFPNVGLHWNPDITGKWNNKDDELCYRLFREAHWL